MPIEPPNWDTLKPTTKLNLLSGETLVAPGLLLELPELVKAIRDGQSQAECLRIVEENF